MEYTLWGRYMKERSDIKHNLKKILPHVIFEFNRLLLSRECINITLCKTWSQGANPVESIYALQLARQTDRWTDITKLTQNCLKRMWPKNMLDVRSILRGVTNFTVCKGIYFISLRTKYKKLWKAQFCIKCHYGRPPLFTWVNGTIKTVNWNERIVSNAVRDIIVIFKKEKYKTSRGTFKESC